jgi:hypothetical protein
LRISAIARRRPSPARSIGRAKDGCSSLKPLAKNLARSGERSAVFEQTFKNIDDVLWKEAGCATELDYTEQTSWILFLKYLDDLERANQQRAQLSGKPHTFIIDKAHRWSVWAAPKKREAFRPL